MQLGPTWEDALFAELMQSNIGRLGILSPTVTLDLPTHAKDGIGRVGPRSRAHERWCTTSAPSHGQIGRVMGGWLDERR